MITNAPQRDASSLSSERSSYPGGKSGAGIFQRLISLIPPHRVLVVPFAGHCGVARNIRPAEHTIVIDRDASVCQWWSDWCRTKHGRALEIHHCDGIEWMRYRFGCTEYSDAGSGDTGLGVSRSRVPGVPSRGDRRLVMPPACDRLSQDAAGTVGSGDARGDWFVFCDPPYVMSQRVTGRIYDCEMTDADHQRLLGTVSTLPASRYRVMLCGYPSGLYASLQAWTTVDHRVPTRGGLQAERIWMNYPPGPELHDYRYIGASNRSRERIRRRQKNWLAQLAAMPAVERQAMLSVLTERDAGAS